jgi:PP-loop superfamily ATP-utilizing enzyme
LAESIVKSVTFANIVRVRTIGKSALVEVDRESVPIALEKKQQISSRLREIGYDSVDVDCEGYISGRMLELFVKNSE